jgi:hypothetical protein
MEANIEIEDNPGPTFIYANTLEDFQKYMV